MIDYDQIKDILIKYNNDEFVKNEYKYNKNNNTNNFIKDTLGWFIK